ncbi:hypothetical protein HAX54_002646 [Datura stramonium]|uniref:Uncharacterized protein n=1 Tax=Datura stramonium TaxID=4076 RepID=A0ABS8T6D4_DATST|nr:hypothetical protein [Datura stramonium]
MLSVSLCPTTAKSSASSQHSASSKSADAGKLRELYKMSLKYTDFSQLQVARRRWRESMVGSSSFRFSNLLFRRMIVGEHESIVSACKVNFHIGRDESRESIPQTTWERVRQIDELIGYEEVI